MDQLNQLRIQKWCGLILILGPCYIWGGEVAMAFALGISIILNYAWAIMLFYFSSWLFILNTSVSGIEKGINKDESKIKNLHG
jgi:hypothetical protein